MKKMLLLFLNLFFLNASAFTTHPQDQWIDLTHDFSSSTLYWPTGDKFKLVTIFDGTTPEGYYYSAYAYSAAEHGGTHMDAPKHFAKYHEGIDKVPLNRLIGQSVMIDVSNKALASPDYLVTIKDVLSWEKQHQSIPPNSIVLINTGFHRYWPDPVKYLGTAQRGVAAVAKLHFPGISPKLAKWLIEKRRLKAIGIDTASIDVAQTDEYPSHQILTKHNVPIFENVANLDILPPTGFSIIALPMKIAGGSGAPLRIIASVNHK